MGLHCGLGLEGSAEGLVLSDCTVRFNINAVCMAMVVCAVILAVDNVTAYAVELIVGLFIS